jgi:hypothetical protein
MRQSIAVINPSFCEGWSTTVEEAKAIGARLLLSDLNIHREQTNGEAYFFDPFSTASIVGTLEECWDRYQTNVGSEVESAAYHVSLERRAVFAETFVEICECTLR